MWIILIFCFLYWAVFDSISTIALIYLHWKLIKEVIPWLWLYTKNRRMSNFRRFGEWAVVTGATDGIGKCYAKELASQGLNIVLISRTLSKLEGCAKEIESTFGVKTHIVVCDFSTGFKNYDHLRKSLEGLEIGLLINNVGMAPSIPDEFVNISLEFNERILNTNVVSMLQMTHAILPQMLERGRGTIINISSASAIFPFPNATAYAATKAFMRKFSADLALEVGHKGVQVQTVLPGSVATKMTYSDEGSEQFCYRISPQRCVRESLERFECAQETFGSWQHAILMALVKFSRSISDQNYVNFLKRRMTDERERILRLADEGKFTIEKM